jgi:protein-S-isoprenylcysteine O-methyltransferase Ste14
MADTLANSRAEPQRGLAAYQRVRRYVLGALLFGLAAGLLFVDSLQPRMMHTRIELWGMMFILAGIVGRLWSTLYIGGRKSSQIVDVGPYSITRNPLYFFSAVAAAGVGMQVGSWGLGLIFAVLCWIAFTVVIRREEGFLTGLFGIKYQNYLKRVPRFMPNPLLYKDREEVTFQPARLKQTLVDGLFFFLAVPIFELIEKSQDTGVIPVLLSLP